MLTLEVPPYIPLKMFVPHGSRKFEQVHMVQTIQNFEYLKIIFDKAFTPFWNNYSMLNFKTTVLSFQKYW